LDNSHITPNEANEYLEQVNSTPVTSRKKISEILARPQVEITGLLERVPRGTFVHETIAKVEEEFPAKLYFAPVKADKMYLPYNPVKASNVESALENQTVVSTLGKEILESSEIAVKYRGYIEREKRIADKILKLENITIPEDFDFSKVTSLSIESRQKLIKHRPTTIAQASRIPGVSPADVSVLLVFFGR
jgi:tRNA uridine 5-carboxymethylaminomethyl modification enzyme